MNNSITITFASRADHAQALKQITKARDYKARGKQLGCLGQGLLLSTLERAERVATGHELDADFVYCLKSILRETDRKMDVRKDFSLMVYREGLKRAIETTEGKKK